MNRYIADRTNEAEIRPEEQSENAESCQESLWNEMQLKGPHKEEQTQEQNKKEWASSVGLCQRRKRSELTHSFLLCSCVYFCLCGPFNRISFHKFSRQLSHFSLCSSGLNSASSVLSTICLFMKVPLSPDVIPSGCPGSKHHLTN